MPKAKETVRLEDLKPNVRYKVNVLMDILKDRGSNHSIYTIRDYESCKCLDYKCGNRHPEDVKVCVKCGGAVRKILIPSPRTRGGGTGVGHRRYDADQIRKIVEVIEAVI